MRQVVSTQTGSSAQSKFTASLDTHSEDETKGSLNASGRFCELTNPVSKGSCAGLVHFCVLCFLGFIFAMLQLSTQCKIPLMKAHVVARCVAAQVHGELCK